MSHKTPPPSKPTLEEVRNQFETWRKGKQWGSRIPDGLWESAVKLSQEYSIHQISRALRLNYSELKDRVMSCTGNKVGRIASGPEFVEVDFITPIPSLEWVVEIEAPNGARMKISSKGQSSIDLLTLTKDFWSQGS